MSAIRGIRLLVPLVLLSLAASCASAGPSTPLATATRPPTSTPPPGTTYAVAARLVGGGKFGPGDNAQVTATFQPVIVSIQRKPDGGILSVSFRPWDSPRVAKERVCTNSGAACQAKGDWFDFEAAHSYSVPVKWIGARAFWVTAEFRDASGEPVAGVDENQQLGAFARASIQLVGEIDSRTPDVGQAPLVQTLLAPTRLAFPVRGFVEIAGGGCCLGGKLGTVLEIPVEFDAQGPAGPAVQMRTLGRCPSGGENLTGAWESFVKTKSYSYTVSTTNWVGWYIAVQYRDARGNLSPVYCDDISIEGLP